MRFSIPVRTPIRASRVATIVGTVAIVTALVGCSAPAPEPTPGEPTTLTLSTAQFDSGFSALFVVGRDLGYYEEQGVDLEMIQMAGSAAAQALVADQIDLTASSGSAMTAAIQGLPIRVIASLAQQPQYSIWSTDPEVTTLEEMAEKPIGIQTLGDTYHETVILTMLKEGIDVDALNFIALGAGNVLPGLISGSVSAAPLLAVDSGKLEDAAGVTAVELADPRDLGVHAHQGGIAASRLALAEKKDAIEGFLVATRLAMHYIGTHPEESAELWAAAPELAGSGDTPEFLLETIRQFWHEDGTTVFPSTGTDSVEDQQLFISVKEEYLIGDASLNAKPEDVFDYAIVKQAYAEADELWAASPDNPDNK